MLNQSQKQVAQAIVNIFETGKITGEYGQITLLEGDTGHLTYGRSQTTLASANLFLLIKAYCDTSGATFSNELAQYLDRLEAIDLSLDTDRNLWSLLREAGDDPIMQRVQDAFFDRIYWQPSLKSAAYVGITSALGTAVVYDSRIHGSWHRIRDRTIESFGANAADGRERQWVENYVAVRQDWLANHTNPLLRRTVYRMESFGQLIQAGNWDLTLPCRVRGLIIDDASLNAPIRVRAVDTQELNDRLEEPGPRLLRLRHPHMQGKDVKLAQEKLTSAGITTVVDGDFGKKTDANVKTFQKREGLVADGIVGPATWSALGVD
jgi:chitosanase